MTPHDPIRPERFITWMKVQIALGRRDRVQSGASGAPVSSRVSGSDRTGISHHLPPDTRGIRFYPLRSVPSAPQQPDFRVRQAYRSTQRLGSSPSMRAPVLTPRGRVRQLEPSVETGNRRCSDWSTLRTPDKPFTSTAPAMSGSWLPARGRAERSGCLVGQAKTFRRAVMGRKRDEWEQEKRRRSRRFQEDYAAEKMGHGASDAAGTAFLRKHGFGPTGRRRGKK